MKYPYSFSYQTVPFIFPFPKVQLQVFSPQESIILLLYSGFYYFMQERTINKVYLRRVMLEKEAEPTPSLPYILFHKTPYHT